MVESNSNRELNIKCKIALNEFSIPLESNIIYKEYYVGWLNKHQLLCNEFELPPLSNHTEQTQFYGLFGSLQELVENLKYEHTAFDAMSDYVTVDQNNETEIIEWALKYESLGLNLTSFYNILFEFILDPKELRISEYVIDKSDFTNIISFYKPFNECYWALVEKYNTISDKEHGETLYDETTSRNYSSLTYHLKVRGVI